MMTALKIERGVPFPTTYNRYPFGKMEIGDSFFVELEPKRVSAAAATYRRMHPGFRFCTRKVREGGKCGTRVWRIQA